MYAHHGFEEILISERFGVIALGADRHRLPEGAANFVLALLAHPLENRGGIAAFQSQASVLNDRPRQ